MALNLDKHRESLLTAWKEVLDEKNETNWALFGYDGLSNDLKFIGKGDGGLIELIDDLNSGKIMYAFLKIDVPDGSISKYVLINWQGEGAPTVRKGTCANHIKEIARFFSGFHLTMHARTEDDLEENLMLDKLDKAGSAFNFKSARTEELPPSGPVGTVYKKVNPVQEINSKERDQFWLKEEQEEKRRVEAEKKRREEDKKKTDEEVRKRDEMEASIRDKSETERVTPGTDTSSPASMSASKSASMTASMSASMTASDSLRKQRSAEAKQLIGHSTANARAMFEQNLAQGQLNNKSRGGAGAPEKPARSSVIAQRIHSFTQHAQPPPAPLARPAAPTASPLAQEPTEPIRTSPIRNIDKIKMSLESPSQIQYEPIIDPADLSPGAESEPGSFSAVGYNEWKHTVGQYRDVQAADGEPIEQSEPIIKQNILENDMFDAAYCSSNDNDDEDSDNKFSTIKRSPYSRVQAADERATGELSRQNTVIENVNYKKELNGTSALDAAAPDEDCVYEDLHDDPGLTAQALYDYQAADETEITFDPGDVITHIDQIDEGWWQGLGPHGVFGLFPANYVELLPCRPR